MNTIIPYTDTNLKWHLRNNVMPALSDQTIDRIVRTCNLVNTGEMALNDEITEGANVTVEEMLLDLNIDFND